MTHSCKPIGALVEDPAWETIPPRQWFDWFLMAAASAAIMLATVAVIDWWM